MNNKIIGIGFFVAFIICSVLIWYAVFYEEKPPELPPFPIGEIPLDNQSLGLKIGWNLISVPEYTNENGLYFTYQNTSYNFTEANEQDIIFDLIYWFDGVSYILVDECIPYSGCWLYVREEPVYLSLEPQVIFCSKLIQDDNATNITTNKVIINPDFPDTVYYNTITFQSIEFWYYGEETL